MSMNDKLIKNSLYGIMAKSLNNSYIDTDMAAELADNHVDRLSEAMRTDLNKLDVASKYKCDQASAYAATLMNYPHICRMQCERDDLLHNMAKLSNYYEGHFSELTGKQRDYMCKQLTAMRAYADILQERITYDIQYYSYNTK